MWALRQPGPGRFERVEVPTPTQADLGDDDVLVRTGAGAICGSDLPKFRGVVDIDHMAHGAPGAPLHELVGEVVASRSARLPVGCRVVGRARNFNGLAEYFVNPAAEMYRITGDPDDLDDLRATTIQPVGTVLSALDRVPDVRGARVAVLGLGPLGLLFTHVLKTMGAATVIGVDRVDRSDVATTFGVDELVVGNARQWSGGSWADDKRPALVVDAVGHHQDIIADAIDVLAPHGDLLLFGLPEDHYVIPMRSFFRKQLTMRAGTTTDWPRFLADAETYLRAHPELVASYITDVYPMSQAQEAFERYGRPAEGRLKVGLTPDL